MKTRIMMQQEQQDRNRNTENESGSANPQRSGEQVPGQEQTSNDQERQLHNEEWKKGISAGSHEKMNVNNPSDPGGTSSIPLEKNDTIGNP